PFAAGASLHRPRRRGLKKLLASIVTASALALPLTGTALADAGGVPNDNACHGQFVKLSLQVDGVSLQQLADLFEQLVPTVAAEIDAVYGNGNGDLTAGELS